jgi:hypothetical protein
MINTEPYPRHAQFIVMVVGLAIPGKKLMTKARRRKAIERRLMGRPHRPRLNDDWSIGSPRMRRRATQEMERAYEESKAASPRERI